MMYNYWFERGAEPEFENRGRTAGDFNKENALVTDITKHLFFSIPPEKTLPEDCHPSGGNNVLIIFLAHMSDNFNNTKTLLAEMNIFSF